MTLDRIGPYQILDKLGSGGMGNVYLGRHEESGREVAVKVLTASLAREAGFVERFNREIDAMRKLKNPHIVELFESGVEGENYYYVMEYVAGETLMSLMRRERRLPWQKAIDIACQICRALKAAHDTGIIHRDLKPSNLMVTPEGIIKLTDFGVAQVFASGRLTVTGGIIGTAEYMSPEQGEGKRAGKQSDLYSLGAVMYAMVTGRVPFSGSTAVEVIQKHKFGLFDRPQMYVPDLPQRVDDTICRLLEKNPDKRFPDALVLLRHLEQVVRLEDFAPTAVSSPGEGANDLGATTVAATDLQAHAVPGRPGPATMMQGLMRAELTDAARGGPLTALFNNTYVLVGLLALTILGGVWWFRPHTLTNSEKLEKAKTLLAHEPGPEWLSAKRELLEPLLNATDVPHEKVIDLLQEIELYELTRPARGSPGLKGTVPRTESERLVQLATHHRQIGDLGRAERTLEALRALLAGDDQQVKLYELAGQILEEVRKQRAQTADRDSMLKGALERAAAYAEAGSIAAAREIWSSILELYADNPTAAEFVKQAKEGMERNVE